MEKTILLVDDEGDLRKIISFKLENTGYKVVEAANGDEAIEKAAAVNPDLILMDVMMPGKNGFDACQEIRDNGYENKIVIYTAKVDAVDATRARKAGADDFTVKTTELAEILTSLENLL